MNANTIANALAKSNPANTPAVLSNPSTLTLFQYSPSAFDNDNPGTLLPLVLEVPSQPSQVYSASGTSGSGAGIASGSRIVGGALPVEEWTCDGRAFVIRVNGTVSPLRISDTITLDLYWGNGISLANGGFGGISVYNLTATLPATNPFASNFNLETICMWDSTSNTLNTYTYGNLCGTLISGQVQKIINVAPGQVQFVAGASLNDSGAGQTKTFNITLNDFSADMD